MARYCMSMCLYFHEPQASENTAQECYGQVYEVYYYFILRGQYHVMYNLIHVHVAIPVEYIYLITLVSVQYCTSAGMYFHESEG